MPWSIEKLEIDQYDNRNRNIRESTDHATWEDIHKAILSLDAGKRSCMNIIGSDGSVLTIGGGKNMYTASLMCSDGKMYTLVDPSQPDEEGSIVAGGQRMRLPRRMIVDLDTMMRAARRFVERGEREPTVGWEET